MALKYHGKNMSLNEGRGRKKDIHQPWPNYNQPRIFDYDEDYYGPIPDMEDAHATVLLWQNAQHRLERVSTTSQCF